MELLGDLFQLAVHLPVTTTLIILLIALVSKALYRIYLHPLAKFPGPKLAALTFLYEFYFDGVKQGQYTNEIARMHQKYGPIIRINPEELHVNDAQFINELYAGGSKKRDKYIYYCNQFSIPKSSFGTISHDLHRLRRGALNRYFSKASVATLESQIHDKVQKLCDQLESHAGHTKPVDLTMAFSCLTTDVITEYAFGQSYNFLDSPTFEPNLRPAIFASLSKGPLFKQLPFIITLMQLLPVSLVTAMMPDMAVYFEFQAGLRAQIQKIQQRVGKDFENQSQTGATVFHEILQGDLPDEEKGTLRLAQESQAIIGAGTETTAWTLSVIMCYLLSQPATLSKLERELAPVIHDPKKLPTWAVLEKLPYLAVILEGLRLSYGLATRLQRISPEEPLYFRSSVKSENHESPVDYVIPPGTPVGMTSVLIHHNPDIFPDPLEFLPERWLDVNGQRTKGLNGFLLSFSKGTRQCLGINLAYAELYLTLPAVVGRLAHRLELFETTVEDVRYDHECFVPVPKNGSRGVRVLVK